MIRINVTLVVKNEVHQQMVELLQEMSEMSRQEEGCIGYEIMSSSRSDNTFMIIETWENGMVLDKHKQSEHFTRIIPRVRTLASEMISEYFTTGEGVEEVITQRQDVKEYLPEQVPAEILEQVLRAGMYAPAVRDRRPWEFFVIKEQKQLLELVQIFPDGNALKTAPVAVLVCCNTREAGLDGGNWPQKLGACVQNVLLQAQGKGWGTSWVGIYPRMRLVHEVKTALCLSSEFVPFALVTLGKPSGEKVLVPERYNPAKIHYITR